MVLAEADFASGNRLCLHEKTLLQRDWSSMAHLRLQVAAIKAIIRDPTMVIECACAPHNAPQ